MGAPIANLACEKAEAVIIAQLCRYREALVIDGSI
jgi:hypothetical protein